MYSVFMLCLPYAIGILSVVNAYLMLMYILTYVLCVYVMVTLCYTHLIGLMSYGYIYVFILMLRFMLIIRDALLDI